LLTALAVLIASCAAQKAPLDQAMMFPQPATQEAASAPVSTPKPAAKAVRPAVVEEEEEEEEEEDEEESESVTVKGGNVLYFTYASSTLTGTSQQQLLRVASAMKKNKGYRITLNGYACDQGSHEANLAVSLRRVVAASEFLQQQGVSAHRITIKAHGDTNPVVPNNSSVNRAKNRCVTMSIG
jgi:outer membrane protein OmpA-like peptidoglycan-associated protein